MKKTRDSGTVIWARGSSWGAGLVLGDVVSAPAVSLAVKEGGQCRDVRVARPSTELFPPLVISLRVPHNVQASLPSSVHHKAGVPAPDGVPVVRKDPGGVVFISSSRVLPGIPSIRETSSSCSDFRMAVPTLRGRPLKKDFIGSRAVNGQTLDTLGTIDVSLHLGRASWRHTFHVLRESTQAVLLGLDFLAVNRALLDLGRGFLKIGDTCLPLLYQAQLVPECCNVSLADGVIIPPLSEALVPVHVRPPGGANRPVTDFEGYLEPNVPDSAGLVVAHTVANVKNGVTVARVLNPSGKAEELKQGLHIGEFYPIHEVGAPSVVPTSHKSSVPCMVTDSPVNERQRAELQELLSRFSNVFSTPDGNTGKCSLIQHHIRTGDNPPIKQRAYRTSPEKRAEIERQVGQLLADGLVEESFSPWASPVVLVKKKGGQWRFCIDYRRLNAVTIKDSHPLPRVDDSLDALARSMWFSTLDFSNGYWEVEVAEEDREKTAFTTVVSPDFSRPFTVYTNASKDAVGAVLAQENDGLEHVVAYASQALTHTQKRWSTFDRELWAVVWAVHEFKHYVGLSAFTIVTDHRPLLGLRGMSIDNDPTGKRGRWILELDPFNWAIIHKDGSRHLNADALSRRPAEATAPAIDCVNVIDVGGANSHDQARESLPSSPVYSLCCDEARLRSLQQDDPDIRASERQKLYHDQTVCHRPYGVGALVWLNNPTESRTKLAPHWRGPYQVVQVFSSGSEPALTYDIINPLDSQERSQVVHHDRLKPYTLPLPARPPASRVVASDPFLHGGEASLEPALAQPQQSRSGRLVKAPSHLKDFVV
uniref:Reverse transcriptase RNase H-like domain-containing protein n=1 Tax=Knipowitschia caucasica TaxID=637954 RepID=A0AAV2LVC5_KNICA